MSVEGSVPESLIDLNCPVFDNLNYGMKYSSFKPYLSVAQKIKGKVI